MYFPEPLYRLDRRIRRAERQRDPHGRRPRVRLPGLEGAVGPAAGPLVDLQCKGLVRVAGGVGDSLDVPEKDPRHWRGGLERLQDQRVGADVEPAGDGLVSWMETERRRVVR